MSTFNVQNKKNVQDIVYAWLTKEDKVKEKSGDPLTWEALVKALRKIGQSGIAEDILREECSH